MELQLLVKKQIFLLGNQNQIIKVLSTERAFNTIKMEGTTATKMKAPQRTIKKEDQHLLSGTWRLSYKITNRMGPAGFSGRNLTTYNDLITGRPRPLYNADGNITNGYYIERQVTIFTPDTNPAHKNIVDWLLGHPEVTVESKQVNFDSTIMGKKKTNGKIKLVNLDYEEVEDLEQEDFIDKLIGQISLDSGVNAVSLEKLRFILSALNMQYNEAKYINDKTREKQKLRKRLKTFVRRGYEQAKKVRDILEDLDYHKFQYEIKEMVRKDILNISNGMYKYGTNPIAATSDGVVKYFRNNTDFYADLNKMLLEELAKERA